MLDQITPLILTYNEEANIARTLSALKWADQVFIIDSHSTDTTLAICNQFDNVTVIQHPFSSHSEQSNFALSQDIKTDWVLSLDADYVLSEALIRELRELTPARNVQGYRIQFDYLINGKALRGSLYPARTSLYRKKSAHYVQDGHAQRVVIDGEVGSLKAKILHDDRKSFSRWLGSQWNYAKLETEKLKHQSWSELSLPDKTRKIAISPLIVLPYTLIIKGLILNGVPGLIYTGQRFIAESALQFARLKSLFS